jgi:Patatin-like phospholipase
VTTCIRFAAASIALVLLVEAAVPSASASYERAPFWTIAADDYTKSGDPQFPETNELPGDRDIGLAFSGGGVRAATAALGELRGLKEIGLLDRVQYVSAVSGGGWAVIPWMFAADQSDSDLLGRYEDPAALRFDEVRSKVNGTLANAVANVSIELASSREAALEVWAYNVSPEEPGLLTLVRRAIGGALSRDRTYANLLARTLLEPIKDHRDSDIQWNEQHGRAFAELNGHRERRVIQPKPGRPFMIINANLVQAGRDFSYPHAIPFEFTPLYVGTRQSIGGVFGGVYTWPTAYNAVTARTATKSAQGGTLEYSHDETHFRLSLQDLAASTGAAPLFWVVGGSGLPIDIRNLVRIQGGAYFPQFTHMALRYGEVVQSGVRWPHADGGARDNLGITALLARHVKRIIAFVNVDSADFNNNTDIASLFEPGQAATSSDKSGNVVFERSDDPEKDGLTQIRRQFNQLREQGLPVVTCGQYDVKENRLFNIRAYKGVKICWVYPERVTSWVNALDDRIEDVVEGRSPCSDCGNFTRFPWFATFFENRDARKHLRNVGVLNLSRMQVNVLSNLMTWTVVTSKETLQKGLQ